MTRGMEPIQSVVSDLSSKLAIATTRSQAVFVILDNHDCHILHAYTSPSTMDQNICIKRTPCFFLLCDWQCFIELFGVSPNNNIGDQASFHKA